MPDQARRRLSIIPKPMLGIAFAFYAVLSLPLNILVWMRWMGWGWGSALVATILVSMIPIFGQLANVVIALLGIYYLIDAGWDWRKVVDHPPPTARSSPLTLAQFAHLQAGGAGIGTGRSRTPDAPRPGIINI